MKTCISSTNFTNDFAAIWDRIKSETEITSFSRLGELTGTTQQNISAAKKRGEFPVKWAFQIWLKHGITVEWIMTGKGPKRLTEGTQAKLVSTEPKPLPNYLWELAEWATEMSGLGGHEWLQKQLDICLPTFKMWREQKSAAEIALHQDQIDAKKVA